MKGLNLTREWEYEERSKSSNLYFAQNSILDLLFELHTVYY